MKQHDYEEWAAALTLVGEEAFLPEELDGVDIPRSEKPVKTCRKCGRGYIRCDYSGHVEAYHNAGRQAYEREYSRRAREQVA